MKKNEQAKILATAVYQAVADKKDKEMEQVVSNFCDYLKQKGLMRMIPVVLEELESIYFKKKGMVAAEVVSKNELSKSEVERIVKLIKEMTGKEVMVSHGLDDDVIGGAVIRYEDKIIDMSIRNVLRGLKKELVE